MTMQSTGSILAVINPCLLPSMTGARGMYVPERKVRKTTEVPTGLQLGENAAHPL